MSLQLAIKILESVPTQRGKQRLCSVITDRKGNILSIGQNSYVKTHPLQATVAKRAGKEESCFLHSEIAALVKLKGKDKKRANKMYIARLMKNGETGLAMPCSICQLALKEYGVKEVSYTV